MFIIPKDLWEKEGFSPELQKQLLITKLQDSIIIINYVNGYFI